MNRIDALIHQKTREALLREVKQWWVANNIADLCLSAMPQTKSGVIRKARTENWLSRPRSGRGGGREYHISSLPEATQTALIRRHVQEVIKAQPELGELKVYAPKVEPSTKPPLPHQLQTESARLVVCRALDGLVGAGLSFRKAYQTLVQNADEAMEQALVGANHKKQGIPTRQGLEVLFRKFKSGKSLLPKRPNKKAIKAHTESLLPAFLRCYRQPQKPPLTSAYREFKAQLTLEGVEAIPSIHQVRRALEGVGRVELMRGRLMGKNLKAIQPFVRRDTSSLYPLDVFVGDGHTFDAEVINPFSGKPHRPEITIIMDAHTRVLVGWSIDFAESRYAISCALKNAVKAFGIPVYYYSDNGRGQANQMLDDPTNGILPRLGIAHMTGIPGNSQARGNIERLNKTVLVPAAKRFKTYMGADMDSEAKRKVFKATRAELKTGARPAMMPDWAEVVAVIAEEIAKYNHAPHRELGMSPLEFHKARIAELELTIQQPSDQHLETMFLPRIQRKIGRGEVKLGGEVYFSSELTEHDGKTLDIAYEPTDAGRVWVYESGRLICEAKLHANSVAYFPKAQIEKDRDERAKGRMARLQVKMDEVDAELRGGQMETTNAEFEALATKALENNPHGDEPLDFDDFLGGSSENKDINEEKGEEELALFEVDLQK